MRRDAYSKGVFLQNSILGLPKNRFPNRPLQQGSGTGGEKCVDRDACSLS